PIVRACGVRSASTPVKSSRARSLRICRSCSRASSSWSSICRPPGHSVSKSHRCCSPAPTRRSNDVKREREVKKMKLPRRSFLHLAAGAAVLPAASRIARAQAYPARTVTIIVPVAPGGTTDVAARIIGEYMARLLGQQFIVENVPGAGGTTGSTRVMRARPDGYTILMGHAGTHAFSVSIYPNLAYKPDVDFEPIGTVLEIPELI